MPKHIKTNDILNTVHGKLVITEDLGTKNHVRWVMIKCVCGVKKEMRLSSIRNGAKSCGCEIIPSMSRSLLKHGMANGELYSTWLNLRRRCNDTKSTGYEYYGAIGITVCEEWQNDFKSFHDWAMANGWSKGLVIDKDIKGGNIYSPENCLVVTKKINANNKSTTLFLEYKGLRKCFSEWCEIYGLNRKLTHQRIFRNHMTLDEIIRKYGAIYKGDNSITA